MGLSGTPEQMSHYATLTQEEKARMYPCTKAKCVITSVDSSPTLQASIPSSGYDMPDEVRPGKITPKNQRSSPMPSKKDGDVTPEEEMIEEAVPIGHKTFPVPEPPPTVVEHNGLNHDYTDGSEKKLMNDVDDDSCLIKCVYFSQQCCECTIV